MSGTSIHPWICLALAALSMVLLFSLFNSSVVIPLAKMIVLLLSSILSSIKIAAYEAFFNV
jgi:hypothetical protein